MPPSATDKTEHAFTLQRLAGGAVMVKADEFPGYGFIEPMDNGWDVHVPYDITLEGQGWNRHGLTETLDDAVEVGMGLLTDLHRVGAIDVSATSHVGLKQLMIQTLLDRDAPDPVREVTGLFLMGEGPSRGRAAVDLDGRRFEFVLERGLWGTLDVSPQAWDAVTAHCHHLSDHEGGWCIMVEDRTRDPRSLAFAHPVAGAADRKGADAFRLVLQEACKVLAERQVEQEASPEGMLPVTDIIRVADARADALRDRVVKELVGVGLAADGFDDVLLENGEIVDAWSRTEDAPRPGPTEWQPGLW